MIHEGFEIPERLPKEDHPQENEGDTWDATHTLSLLLLRAPHINSYCLCVLGTSYMNCSVEISISGEIRCSNQAHHILPWRNLLECIYAIFISDRYTINFAGTR